MFFRCQEETKSDFVEFSNFNINVHDRKMERFCGRSESEVVGFNLNKEEDFKFQVADDERRSIRSDGNFFRVTFHSNAVYDASGFSAIYKFTQGNGKL